MTCDLCKRKKCVQLHVQDAPIEKQCFRKNLIISVTVADFFLTKFTAFTE